MNDCVYNKDCLTIPIKDRCFDFCMEKILSGITVEEKQLILGIDFELAQKIFRIYNSRPVNSFGDISRNLSREEEQTLRTRFKNINQYQLNYFLKDRADRNYIVQELRRLDLNSSQEENGEIIA